MAGCTVSQYWLLLRSSSSFHALDHSHYTRFLISAVGSDIDVLDDRDLPALLRRIGYVMQLETPWSAKLTLRENLLYAAMLRLPSAAEALDAVDRVIAMLEMDSFADTIAGPTTGGSGLSGGQKRKLYTAIQLLHEPPVLLFDEPTSGLDASSTLALLGQLRRLGEAGKTVILAIHQPRREVWDMFHHVCVLADGQIVYDGPPETSMPYLTGLLGQEIELMRLATRATNPADAVLDVFAKPHIAALAGAVCHDLPTARTTRRALNRFHGARNRGFENSSRRSLPSVVPPLQTYRTVSRRLNRAFVGTWTGQHLTALGSSIGLGVLYFDATGVDLLTATYACLIAMFILNSATRCLALYNHKKVVASDFRDGVAEFHHLTVAAVGVLFAQMIPGQVFVTVIAMSMAQREFKPWVALGFFGATLAVEAVYNLFIVSVVLLPRLSYDQVYTIQVCSLCRCRFRQSSRNLTTPSL